MHIEFYKSVAEIIPLLFFAVTLQSTFIKDGIDFKSFNHEEKLAYFIHFSMFLLVIFLMLLGEFTALQVLYTGSIEKGSLWNIIVALLLPVVWITSEYIQKVFKKAQFFIRAVYFFISTLMVISMVLLLRAL